MGPMMWDKKMFIENVTLYIEDISGFCFKYTKVEIGMVPITKFNSLTILMIYKNKLELQNYTYYLPKLI